MPNIELSLFENFVYHKVLNTLENSKELKKYFKEKYNSNNNSKLLQKEVNSVKRKIKECEVSEDKLLDLYLQSGIIDKEKYEKKHSEIVMKKNQYEIRLNQLSLEAATPEVKNNIYSYLGKLSSEVQKYRDSIDYEERRKVLKIFLKEVHLDYSEELKSHLIVIELQVPLFSESSAFDVFILNLHSLENLTWRQEEKELRISSIFENRKEIIKKVVKAVDFSMFQNGTFMNQLKVKVVERIIIN